MIKEINNPEYQCQEFLNFCADENLDVELTSSIVNAYSEDESMSNESEHEAKEQL